jgi:hypothetical protein
VSDALNTLGCCIDTWLDFVDYVCKYSLQTPKPDMCHDPSGDPSAIRYMITQLCHLDIEMGCGRRRFLRAVLVAQNLAWAWCVTHQTQCLDIVHNAVANQFNIDVQDVAAVILWQHLSQSAGNTVAGRRLLQGGGDVQISVSGLSNSIGSVDNSTTDKTTIQNVNGSARGDITQPTSLVVLSAEVDSTGGAAGVVPSFGLALLALMLLLL